jgi:uncharacterized membrane protein YciS (DUF1049 family)
MSGRFLSQRRSAMLLILMSAAMMVGMLIATAFTMHQEAQRRRIEARIRRSTPFGPHH